MSKGNDIQNPTMTVREALEILQDGANSREPTEREIVQVGLRDPDQVAAGGPGAGDRVVELRGRSVDDLDLMAWTYEHEGLCDSAHALPKVGVYLSE